MASDRQSPTWPFLAILFVLFLMCISAPRSWERVAREQAVDLVELEPVAADADIEQALLAASQEEALVIHAPADDHLAAPVEAPQRAVEESYEPPIASQPIPPREAERTARVPARIDLAPEQHVLSVESWQSAPAQAQESSTDICDLSDEQPSVAAEQPGVAAVVEDAPTWQVASVLHQRLETLAGDHQCRDWALAALEGVAQIAAAPGGDAPPAALAELHAVVAQTPQMLARVAPGPTRGLLQRTAYDLTRRLAVWDAALELVAERQAGMAVGCPDCQSLGLCVSHADTWLSAAPSAIGWREYLQLEELRRASAHAHDTSRAATRRLAREVLDRLRPGRLTDSQRQFAASGPLVELAAELRHFASEEVDVPALIESLEQYEETRLPSDARLIGNTLARLDWLPGEPARRLGQHVDDHYRNANLRIAVSESFLTRLLPPAADESGAVRERILGADVRGQQSSSTDLSVEMVPGQDHLRFEIVARGRVDARTSAHKGIARLRQRSATRFEIRKPIELDLEGIDTAPARASVDGRSRLTGLETRLDVIPLLGPLVRSIARQQYDQQSGTAQRIMRRRVSSQATARADQMTDAQIGEANNMLDEQLMSPLEQMDLAPSMIDVSTDATRMIMRMRVATEEQLGAHTARPVAPSDSLLSYQVHESLMNNVLAQLELDGKTMSFGELQRWIGAKFHRTIELDPDSRRENVYVSFAEQDAIHVRCDNDRLEVQLHIAAVRRGRQSWRNFTVRAVYRPDHESGRGRLVRDGTVQLIGANSSARGQVTLRSIFSGVFAKNRPWALLPESVVDHDRMGDTQVTQLVIQDGWIGLAVGPRRAAAVATGASAGVVR